MANDLVPSVSLEQAKVSSLALNMQQVEQQNTVTLIVNRVEQGLIRASEKVDKLVPQIQKRLNEANAALNKVTEADKKRAQQKVVDEYKDRPKAYAKLGHEGVKMSVCHVKTKDGKHTFSVWATMHENDYDRHEIPVGKPGTPKHHDVPVSAVVMKADKKMKDLTDLLSKTKDAGLKIKCELQSIGRHERDARAAVITKEREKTEEGRQTLEFIEAEASGKFTKLIEDIEAIGKSIEK